MLKRRAAQVSQGAAAAAAVPNQKQRMTAVVLATTMHVVWKNDTRFCSKAHISKPCQMAVPVWVVD